MKWTKRHSQNAVAAKARRRLLESPLDLAPAPSRRRRLPHPRDHAKWRLQIRDLQHGHSLTLLLYRLPWPARYLGSDKKEYSAAQLGRVVAALLTHAA